MFKSLNLAALFLACVMHFGSASAALISADHSTFGTDSITRDTSSGLNWLDLTVTNGSTRVDVVAQMGSGGLYEGWRYATLNEFEGLMTAGGLLIETATYNSYPTLGYQTAQDTLTGLLGDTYGEYSAQQGIPGAFYGFRGMIDLQTTPGFYSSLGASVGAGGSVQFVDTAVGSCCNFPEFADILYLGHYLVEENVTAVPAHDALLLFGLGALGLGLRRRAT